ncbi:MAG: hypothetical protein SH819_02905 [Cytophagales bacterium]|nr:hypothetical protein [Cytophagales bacterium]
MKMMMRGLILLMIVGVVAGCSKKCNNEAPRARILNNGTMAASVQIKTSDGSTVNINNVAPGTASAYASYAAGEITFTITVDKVPYVKVVAAGNCFQYDIAIDANNAITVAASDRNS